MNIETLQKIKEKFATMGFTNGQVDTYLSLSRTVQKESLTDFFTLLEELPTFVQVFEFLKGNEHEVVDHYIYTFCLVESNREERQNLMDVLSDKERISKTLNTFHLTDMEEFLYQLTFIPLNMHEEVLDYMESIDKTVEVTGLDDSANHHMEYVLEYIEALQENDVEKKEELMSMLV